LGSDPDYVCSPELAEDIRRASYLEGAEIELAADLPDRMRIEHAIFDHDGTLSTLREGWEEVMQPMMVAAILGRHFPDVDRVVYNSVQDTVREFIDKTTGVQTLVQMQGLVRMVRQFEFVPEAEVLDEHGYKHLYNERLLDVVLRRRRKLQSAELAPEDFQIKNAGELLRSLSTRGVKLYLASGTDEADVRREAEAMGYADVFEGRIFGAIGNVKIEAKKVVLERILQQHRLAEGGFATFGDGPVEMRETRKRGGICVGVASDEVRRSGLNLVKRTRLIRAGAHLIVPDFSQLAMLLSVLQLN
jgi:phosphoglycolate phosphatase-like HAD superfamily hydrolase